IGGKFGLAFAFTSRVKPSSLSRSHALSWKRQGSSRNSSMLARKGTVAKVVHMARTCLPNSFFQTGLIDDQVARLHIDFLLDVAEVVVVLSGEYQFRASSLDSADRHQTVGEGELVERDVVLPAERDQNEGSGCPVHALTAAGRWTRQRTQAV